MDDIDAVLSSSLKRIAAPGDTAGVADAIRARVDAGDTGTPASSSGFGGAAASAWVPWLGLVVVAGLVGGALGPLGALGTHHNEVLVAAPVGVLVEATPAYLCAGGAAIGTLFAGERVLTVARSDDSSWLGVRNPDTLVDTLWLPASVVTIDAGQDAAALPTGGACPVITARVDQTTAPAPGPAPAPEPGSGTDPAPGPVPDTTAPSISVGSFSPQPVYGLAAAPYCATEATVTVTATDNVAIASVSGSADTAGGTVQLVSSSGSSYVFAFSAPYPSGPNKVVTVTFTAQDSSGNQASAPRTVVLTNSGNCLI